jgi:excisionase family DNA binding protein
MQPAADNTTLTTRQVAERLGVPEYKVRSLLRRKLLPEPRRHAHFRLFTESDLPQIRQLLELQKKETPCRK